MEESQTIRMLSDFSASFVLQDEANAGADSVAFSKTQLRLFNRASFHAKTLARPLLLFRSMLHLIGFILAGLIVGFIAQALKPGEGTKINLNTVVISIVGAVFAGYWGGYIASVAGAILVLLSVHFFSRNRTVA